MIWISLTLAFGIVFLEFAIFRLEWAIIRSIMFMFRCLPIIRHMTTPTLGLLFLPSTFLHEVYHTVMLMLAGYEVSLIDLTPKIIEERAPTGGFKISIKMGAAIPQRPGDRRFLGLIYIAPLLIGNLILFLFIHFGFRVSWTTLFGPYTDFWNRFIETFWAIARPGNWILIYLLFALGNGAIPGGTDWKEFARHLLTVLIILVVCSFILITVFPMFVLDLTYIELWLSVLGAICIQLALVAGIDLIVWLPLAIPGYFAKQLRLSQLDASLPPYVPVVGVAVVADDDESKT
jgi:hypothetical protein